MEARILEELKERRVIRERKFSKQKPDVMVAKENRVLSQQKYEKENTISRSEYGKEDRGLQSGGHAREHVMKHLREGTFHCQICNEGFSRPSWLKNQCVQHSFTHLERDDHDMKERFHEPMVPDSADSSNTHIQTHISERDAICKIEVESTKTSTIKCERTPPLLEETKEHGGILKENCSVNVADVPAEPIATRKIKKSRHVVDKENIEVCINKEDFSSESQANKVSEPQSDPTCELCGKSMKRKNGREHCTCSKTRNPYQCSLCRKSFPYSYMHQKHMVAHSDEKPFVCSICGKGYKYDSTLKDHVRVKHEGQRPFLCDTCGISFSKRSQLKFHLTVHSGEKSFPCELCPKSFRLKSTLRVHMAWHNGERSHVCQTCGRSYINSSALIEHRRVHTGEKPHKCLICSRAFAHLRTLRNHEKIHSGEKPYECDICHKRFIQLNGLNYHKKLHQKQATN